MAFSGSIFAVNNTLLLKRSDEANNAPEVLALGELAINVADGKLFYKNSTANAIIRSQFNFECCWNSKSSFSCGQRNNRRLHTFTPRHNSNYSGKRYYAVC